MRHVHQIHVIRGGNNKTGNVRTNVILTHIRLTNFAVEKPLVFQILILCLQP